MQPRQRRRRHRPERVDLGPEVAQGLDERRALCRVAGEGRFDDHEFAPAERLRHVGDRRQAQEPSDRGDLVGDGLDPPPPGVQHFAGALDREEEDAGTRLRDRVKPELDRRHDAEAPATAAERPEQLAVVVRVRADQVALRRHELDRGDAVRCEPEAARVPAHATAERVAHDADVGRRAVQRGEPVRDGGVDHVEPDDAGFGPRDSCGWIDAHAAHAVRLDQDRVLQRPQGRGSVARPLRRELEPVPPGEPDERDDVAGRLRQCDRPRALVDREVPRLPCVVPAGIAGEDELAVELFPKPAELVGRLLCESRACHDSSSSLCLPDRAPEEGSFASGAPPDSTPRFRQGLRRAGRPRQRRGLRSRTGGRMLSAAAAPSPATRAVLARTNGRVKGFIGPPFRRG